MKRMICLLLVMLIAGSLAACSATEEALEVLSSIAEATDANQIDTDVTIDEQVLYEGNDVKVTVTGVSYDEYMGPEIGVVIENNTDTDLTFSSEECYINSYAIYSYFYFSVPAGQTLTDSFGFSAYDMALAGISELSTIEMSLSVYDDDYRDIAATDLIAITTSATDGYTPDDAVTGDEVYYDKDNGVRILAVRFDKGEDELFGEPSLILYVENSGKRTVAVSSTEVDVNGKKLSGASYYAVLASGKRSVDAITFYEDDLSESGITGIDEITLWLKLYDNKTYDTIGTVEEYHFTI